MKLIRCRDYAHMSRQAANLIAAQILIKPDSVLGLATGSSPIGAYQDLVKMYKNGDLNFSDVRTVNLDEYIGLDPENDQSYAFFMRDHLFDHVNIDHANTHIPSGTNFDADDECLRYDRLIRSLGGIDLQLLGLGPNGHIGFNEPGDAFPKGTHRVELTQATIQANKRFFESEADVPRAAYTMGIRDIMQAKRVVMVVSGESKAEVVKKAFFGPVTPLVPASILQLHKKFTLIADEAALKYINE